MEKLTDKQKKIVDFIIRVNADSGVSPTIRDIAKSFSLSVGTIQDHCKALIRKGYLKHNPATARGMELSFRKPLLPVPLVGSVHAGTLAEAIADSGEYVYVDSSVLKSGEYFALRVTGDSMTGSGIYEGDLIVVRKQSVAENGEIVAAMIDDNAAVKKFWRRHGTTSLESTNPAYQPITSKKIAILGKVVYLTRRLH
ncbi:MAG: transcriptional repressor LexA [Elusimicrobiota bacterium]